jgi:hypothetical protein
LERLLVCVHFFFVHGVVNISFNSISNAFKIHGPRPFIQQEQFRALWLGVRESAFSECNLGTRRNEGTNLDKGRRQFNFSPLAGFIVKKLVPPVKMRNIATTFRASEQPIWGI